MRWLPRLAVGAAVALAVGLAAVFAVVLSLVLADRPGDSPRYLGRAVVTSTSPADGATLARAPTEVALSFTRPVDQSRSHVFVVAGSGAAPARDAGALRQTAPERLSQPITVTAAGAVTVAYHVTFTDGAVLAGSLRFTARSAAAAGQPAAPASASAHQHDIDPVSAGLLVLDGIAVLAVVVLLLRRPRQPAPVGR